MRAVAFSTNGGMLATGSADKGCRIYKVGCSDFSPVRLQGHYGTVNALVFHPHDDIIATGESPATRASLVDGILTKINKKKLMNTYRQVRTISLSGYGKFIPVERFKCCRIAGQSNPSRSAQTA